MNDIQNEIFNLIKSNQFEKIYEIIKKNKIKNFDFRDSNYNYFIQYIINYNQYKLLDFILKQDDINIRLDILDTDNRPLLYNCIKYSYIELLKILIEYNKASIGISILDMKDKLGLTGLHYAVIFNNFDIFKLLLDNDADPYINAKDGSNVFITCLVYKRYSMIDYLLNKNYDVNFVNNSGYNLLQLALTYQHQDIIDKLYESKQFNINNISNDYGITLFIQSIVLDNFELFKKIIVNKELDINLADFYGNSPLHYIIMEKRIDYLNIILDDKFHNHHVKFNISNINGELPLHLLLDLDIDFDNIININKFIIETDLNLQNNYGQSCFIRIIKKNLLDKFKDILIIKQLNPFIIDNESTIINLNDKLLNILVDSFYNQLKINKDDLILDWEIKCSKKNDILLKKSLKYNKDDDDCKKIIRDIIIKEKRSIPKLLHTDLVFDNGIFTNYCFYTGNPIDILFGLILLHNDFKSKHVNVILDYPLTNNIPLENYYDKLGINYPYKSDFSNIEIIWSYQKIFYPTYFEHEIEKQLKESKYIVIPIGIETSAGSHANILFWDVENKTIERFEPNGSNYPVGFNYNPQLLDNILLHKIQKFDDKITYYKPSDFLPIIGFQLLENIETSKCKKIGDPNGFCGVWCIWWVYQRLLNINNPKYNINNIASELIKNLKYDNKSFKNLIRNFSQKITQIRDSYLNKFNIDINDWIVNNYDEELINKLEKLVLNKIK